MTATSRNDRIRRFQCPLSNLALGLHVGRIEFEQTLMVGVLEAPSRMVGVAEARLDQAMAPTRAEIEVTVDADERRRGLGRRLVAAAIDAAFARGVHEVNLRFDPGTRASLCIATALGARIDLRTMRAVLSRQAHVMRAAA